jgi:hypothetical protein
LLFTSTGAEVDGASFIEWFAFDIAQQGYLRIVFGEIVATVNDDNNAGEGDSEKYRQFSVGRAEAFQDLACKRGFLSRTKNKPNTDAIYRPHRHLERNCSRMSDQSTSKTGIGLEPQSTKELNFAVVINKSLVFR